MISPRAEPDLPLCRRALGPERWCALVDAWRGAGRPPLREVVAAHGGRLGLPAHLADLAELEDEVAAVRAGPPVPAGAVARPAPNPTLVTLELAWQVAEHARASAAGEAAPEPRPGDETVLVWRHPRTDETRWRAATASDLLALKLAVEGVEPAEAARQGGVPLADVEAALGRAARAGLVLVPPPLLARDGEAFPLRGAPGRLVDAPAFSVQWHLTNACELHCRHCYDRSLPRPLELDGALDVVEQVAAFCRARRVAGHVALTGGNPLLYPWFDEVYRAVLEAGLSASILGNPVPRARLERLAAIGRPASFQVSLEGLEEHDDRVRGPGHFRAVLELLDVLRSLDVPSVVMLTLTRDNLEQVLPLAERLAGRADTFSFARLARVGEGRDLELPGREEYQAFLRRYLEAARSNPALDLKENLFNVLRHEACEPLLGGCTGFGCGAAFNFVAIVPDGTVHACRKLPSPIGHVFGEAGAADPQDFAQPAVPEGAREARDRGRSSGLEAAYASAAARAYRRGCEACRGCPLRPACGGCPAVTSGAGLDPLRDRDPACPLPGGG